jgi:hypothetical protein
MQFKNLPDWYPDQERLRELGRDFHARGTETFYRFLKQLFAGELPTSSMVLNALERPGDFGLLDASEPPPPRPDVTPEPAKAGPNPTSKRRLFAVRRQP